LELCYELKDFEHFDDVIFTDETGYWLQDTKHKGWFPKNQSITPMEIECEGKLNIWAGISSVGKVGIYVFEDNFESGIYEDILRTVLVPAARELFPDGCYLHRDNLPAHRAINIERYLRTRDANIIIDTIPWPSYSPDLNP